MRKTKRFTSTAIARFEREGRGQGQDIDYLPWHRVTRGDPSSIGRSHLLIWRGRFRELLSDGELAVQHFISMLPGVVDSREQFPLPLHSDHPIGQGTLELAEQLGIKHPMLREKGIKQPWILTTDFVVDLNEHGQRSQIAIACKPKDWKDRKRTIELLELEREYWSKQGVQWLLITPEEYERSIEMTMRRVACWALTDPLPESVLEKASQLAKTNPCASITELISGLELQLFDHALGQRALWQSIWKGHLPVDLRMGWRPHQKLKHLSLADFIDQNPIAARRSAWNS